MHEGEGERQRERERERAETMAAASALATRLGRERERENEMDGLSTGNGFDHSFQRQGGGCSGGRRQQVQGEPRNLTEVGSWNRVRFAAKKSFLSIYLTNCVL